MQRRRAFELKCNIFKLIARDGARLRRTLKFGHLSQRTPGDKASIVACQIAASAASDLRAGGDCRSATRLFKMIRARDDTPSRSAGPQTTFTSNSLTWAAA